MAARHPRSQQIPHGASGEEAAAIVAAIETFMRTGAPPAAPIAEHEDPWLSAGVREGVSRELHDDPGDPWINT